MRYRKYRGSGTVVAVEHTPRKPKLWLERRRIGELPAELSSIQRRHYLSHPMAASGSKQYCRHSDLRTYAELAAADLVAMTPVPMGEADQIVETLFVR